MHKIASNNLLEEWMLSPGIVKKLQITLSISLLLNGIFIYQMIYTQLDQPKQETSSKRIQTNEKLEAKVTDQELKAFVKEYLINFFGKEDINFKFIAEHTETNLYQNSLSKELEARKTLNLDSNFELRDIYLESLNNTNARAFINGTEIFTKQDYINRNYSIEIIINTEELKITNIPKFEIKQ